MKDFFIVTLSGDDYLIEASDILQATSRAVEIAEYRGHQIVMIYDIELKEQHN